MSRAQKAIGSVLLTNCIFCLQAWSQTASVGPLSSNETTSGTQLEEVVVTAEKRAENLQNVPISVTAVTSSELAAAGVAHVEDLPNVLPGLQIPDAAGFALPRVRGVGTTVNAPGNENPVAVVIDGVYIASPPGSVLSLNNISQVELLKGPQGTLFGRNATGGVLQINTREPGQELNGDVEVGYGNYDTYTGSVYVGGPISSMVSADIAAQAEHQGIGYGTNQFNGTYVNQLDVETSLRSKWVIKPTDATTIHVAFDYSRSAGTDNTSLNLYPGTGSPFTTVNLTSPWNSDGDFPSSSKTETGGVAVTAEQKLGALLLTSITAYRRLENHFSGDFDVTPVPALGLFWDAFNQQFTEELRLQSADRDSKLDWTLGLYFFHSKDSFDPENIYFFGPLAASGLSVLSDQAQETANSYAGFAQATYEILPDTHFTAGARYTYEVRGLEAQQSGTPTGTDVVVPLGPPIDPTSVSADKVTWRGALDHRFSPEVLGYVSVNTGFKSGGYNLSSPADPPFKAETLTAFELGVKTDLLDRRVRLDLAGFYYDYGDIQVSAYTAAGGSQVVYNGAKSKIYGLDFDYEALLTDRLSLSGGMEGLHTEFTSFPNAVIGTPQPMGGVALTSGSAEGNELPYSSPFQTSTTLTYKQPTTVGELAFSGTYGFTDRYYGTADNRLSQSSYSYVSASILGTSLDGKYSVRIWGKNLSDAKVYSVMAESALADAILLQAPRTFGITLSAKF